MTYTSQRPLIPVLAVVLLVAAIGHAGAPVLAQGAAMISGVARDSTGSAMPGVTVTVTNGATGAERTAVTDAEGRYQLTALPSGRYEVRAALAGFRTGMQSVELAGATWSSTSRCGWSSRSRSW